MSDKLGMVQLASRQNSWTGQGGLPSDKGYSEETARTVDAEILRIINECHERAKRLLEEHRSRLDALARTLLEKETLDEVELRQLTSAAPPQIVTTRA